MKSFYAYKIYCDPFNVELISGIMWEFDITGLMEDDDHVTVFASDSSSDGEKQFIQALEKMDIYLLLGQLFVRLWILFVFRHCFLLRGNTLRTLASSNSGPRCLAWGHMHTTLKLPFL